MHDPMREPMTIQMTTQKNRPYFRPIVQLGPIRPEASHQLANGPCWFTHIEKIQRNQEPIVIEAAQIPPEVLTRLTTARAPVCGLGLDRPIIMGILNVTPDSFSDGGRFMAPDTALEHARLMVRNGADIVDIGGESTRPNAKTVSIADEIARTAPVITALDGALDAPVSIDTRKSAVARAALDAGAKMLNDVAAFTFDPALAGLAAQSQVPVCLMHAQGDPQTMQDAPHYDDVLLDVYDFLEDRIAVAVAAGIPRDRIIVDSGVGFGKTTQHCLNLLQRISLFHTLGCAILLGVSRKRFIGEISQTALAQDRASGSISVGLAALDQGVQILRVHDVAETRQAIDLWQAVKTSTLGTSD